MHQFSRHYCKLKNKIQVEKLFASWWSFWLSAEEKIISSLTLTFLFWPWSSVKKFRRCWMMIVRITNSIRWTMPIGAVVMAKQMSCGSGSGAQRGRQFPSWPNSPRGQNDYKTNIKYILPNNKQLVVRFYLQYDSISIIGFLDIIILSLWSKTIPVWLLYFIVCYEQGTLLVSNTCHFIIFYLNNISLIILFDSTFF